MGQEFNITQHYSSAHEFGFERLSPKRGIRTSNIVLLAFFSAFFSRILDTLGAPSAINFLHFITVPFAFAIALSQNRIRNKKQIEIIYILTTLITTFFCCVLVSSIVNNAGIVNGILSFLLWGEPYLIIIAILCLPTDIKILRKFSRCIKYSLFFHTGLAFIQHFILHLHRLPGAQDNIQGVFYRSGAGHVVGASVALTFAAYFIVTSKDVKLPLRVAFMLATFWHMLIADAKQVLLSFIIGSILLLATKLKNIGSAIKYVSIGSALGVTLWWCIQNIEAFRAFKTWIRPEIYGPGGEATLLKFATFRVVPRFYDSSLNWLFGLGPGHTVDRLGGWMLHEYSNLLYPLGSTVHEASFEIWRVVGASWLGNQSSMFSPMFGWAAIWGDFGLVGLAVYLSLGIALYFLVCTNDISKFILFSVFVVGWVFTQMQEPAYMLTISVLLGLNWHENLIEQSKPKSRRPGI